MLPILEFPTPAIYHATHTALSHLDRVQKRFLREVGLTAEDALLSFRFAPLQTRRDIAALGLIHRAVLGEGPPHFQQWFHLSNKVRHSYRTKYQTKLHNKQLHDYLDGSHNELIRRSLLGLTKVYNHLQQKIVDAKTVKTFQKHLQGKVKEALQSGEDR